MSQWPSNIGKSLALHEAREAHKRMLRKNKGLGQSQDSTPARERRRGVAGVSGV